MVAVLSLSQTQSNYDQLPAAARSSLADPVKLGDNIWDLATKAGKVSRDLKVINNNNQQRTVDIKASKFRNLTFEFRTDGGTVDVQSTSFLGSRKSNGATFNETGVDNSVESLVFRNASKLNNVIANLGGGDDGIELGRSESETTPTTSTGGKYSMGTGKDSVIFGANTKLKGKNIVDLGSDNDVDVVSIEDSKGKLPNVKGLQIDNFGNEDILKIGGVDFTRAQLEVLDGKIAGITVNFRQNLPS